ALDHFLEQQVQLAVGQLALDLGQRQRFGAGEVQGALDQQAGALLALVDREGLGDRLEEADLQAGLLEGADQAEADGVETTAEAGGSEEQSVHGFSLGELGAQTLEGGFGRGPARRNPTPRGSRVSALAQTP